MKQTLKAWTDWSFNITFKTTAWAVIDITWYTVYFVITTDPISYQNPTFGEVARKEATLTDPTNWVCYVEFTPAETELLPIWKLSTEISFKKPDTKRYAQTWYWTLEVSILANNDFS